MNTTTINLRIDEKTKKEAQKIFEKMGMSLSTGIKIFLKNVNKTKKIPFEITENGFTPEYEEKILKDVEWTKKHGKAYSSVDEMFEDILK